MLPFLCCTHSYTNGSNSFSTFLSYRLTATFKNLRGKGRLSEADVDATVREIRRALLDHCVIFFRDQKLDIPQHKAFARKFGEIFIHPNYKGTQADPEIVQIRREPGDLTETRARWRAACTRFETVMSAQVLGVFAVVQPIYDALGRLADDGPRLRLQQRARHGRVAARRCPRGAGQSLPRGARHQLGQFARGL